MASGPAVYSAEKIAVTIQLMGDTVLNWFLVFVLQLTPCVTCFWASHVMCCSGLIVHFNLKEFFNLAAI